MSTIQPETIISRAQGFTTAPVQDELMMLNVQQGSYYSLDPIAAEIWTMIETPISVTEIINRLQARYDVNYDQCLADVSLFLGEMQEKGMILVK